MNWLPGIFRRNKLYGDLGEELRLHLEERTEQFMSEGMSRIEAEQAARRAFGNSTVLEERSREVWRLESAPTRRSSAWSTACCSSLCLIRIQSN
jgi:hypothetical protein